ncbi:hypothetical protein SP21_83 [Salmonella phage 21]|nr:hypothetical protein SP21_83 [Salmonella phage 21]
MRLQIEKDYQGDHPTCRQEKVQVSGSVQRYQAGIAINAETFSILIDGIYNDKVLSAVREPLFDAVDSHTEAG